MEKSCDERKSRFRCLKPRTLQIPKAANHQEQLSTQTPVKFKKQNIIHKSTFQLLQSNLWNSMDHFGEALFCLFDCSLNSNHSVKRRRKNRICCDWNNVLSSRSAQRNVSRFGERDCHICATGEKTLNKGVKIGVQFNDYDTGNASRQPNHFDKLLFTSRRIEFHNNELME
jgi:hypothetical protein